MRAVLFAGTAIVALSTASQASVIYKFEPSVVSIINPDRTPYAKLGNYKAGFSIELADTAISRGSFSIKGSPWPGLSGFRGDVGDFVRFTGPEVTFSAASGYSTSASLDLTMTFDAYGNVLSGDLLHYSANEKLTLSIKNNYVSGVWSSEYPACWHGCSEEGALLIYNVPSIPNVPEPASLALLSVGLTGIVAARRRRG